MLQSTVKLCKKVPGVYKGPQISRAFSRARAAGVPVGLVESYGHAREKPFCHRLMPAKSPVSVVFYGHAR